MLNFNSNGFLIPNNNIKSSVEELESTFVKAIPSVKRNELFRRYISYSRSLKELCNNTGFIQWIDGSFTTKKTDPDDIDLVTFIDSSIVDSLIDNLTNYKHPASQNTFGVDAYIVKVYQPTQKFYQLYQSDRAYWMEHFSRTRRNRVGNILQKGFLEINM